MLLTIALMVFVVYLQFCHRFFWTIFQLIFYSKMFLFWFDLINRTKISSRKKKIKTNAAVSRVKPCKPNISYKNTYQLCSQTMFMFRQFQWQRSNIQNLSIFLLILIRLQWILFCRNACRIYASFGQRNSNETLAKRSFQ